MAEAKMTVARRHRFVGSAVQFRVMIDRTEHGRLSPGDDLTVETTAGRHDVYVTTDGRVRSRTLSVDLSSGETLRILSSSPSNPIMNILRIFFRPSETLEIELLPPQRRSS